jgi:hypothetical protein
MPIEFRGIFQQNKHLLHGVSAMGAEAIMQWAKARHDVRLIVIVVHQTFGGFLNFVPHLHVMVSAGGLHESTNRWIPSLKFDDDELMRAWRYALIAFMAEACKRGCLKSNLSKSELFDMFTTQHKRRWNLFVGRRGSKAYRLQHDGRYVRRPPIAQHRLARVGSHEVEYLARDTRNKQFVTKRYKNEEFVDTLIQHVPPVVGTRCDILGCYLRALKHVYGPPYSYCWVSCGHHTLLEPVGGGLASKPSASILFRIVSVARCIGSAVEHRFEWPDSNVSLQILGAHYSLAPPILPPHFSNRLRGIRFRLLLSLACSADREISQNGFLYFLYIKDSSNKSVAVQHSGGRVHPVDPSSCSARPEPFDALPCYETHSPESHNRS